MKTSIVAKNKAPEHEFDSQKTIVDVSTNLSETVESIASSRKIFGHKNVCVILAVPGGSSNKLIVSLNKAAEKLEPIIALSKLDEFGKPGSFFHEHPPKPGYVPGIEAATGSLGHGFPIALGMALAGKINKKSYRTYALLSDGECNEGSIWESAMLAASNSLYNLTVLIDFNNDIVNSLKKHGTEAISIHTKKNNIIGDLRSGSYNPMFKQVIGIAMVKKPYFEASQSFKIDINGNSFDGTVCDLPFI